MEQFDIEIWKPIKNYEGLYEISNYGAVKSLKRTIKAPSGNRNIKERLLSIVIGNRGYKIVLLRNQGCDRVYLVHRLVAEAFLLNAENNPMVNHKDGNKLNNQSENLEWCTAAHNIRHAFRTGLNGNKRVRGKNLSVCDVLRIKELKSIGLGIADISRQFPQVTYSCINAIFNNRVRKNVILATPSIST